MSSALAQLKSELQLKHGLKLIEAENLKSSIGIRTGWSALDSFVASGGFPCGELSLLESPEGLGALTLWLEAAAGETKKGHRVAWLNSALDEREPFQLHAPAASNRGVDLQKLFLVDTPTAQKRAWILQELLASQLFSLVGCDLGDVHLPLRECRSLLMQARRSGAAVVLFSRRGTRGFEARGTRGDARRGTRGFEARGTRGDAARVLASLVLQFISDDETQNIEVVRAAHRPVPQNLKRRDRHVDFITGSNSHLGLNGTDSRPRR